MVKLSVNFPKCPAFMSNTKKYTQNNPVSFRKKNANLVIKMSGPMVNLSDEYQECI